MEIHQVGDQVWLAEIVSEKVYEPCPICFGKKAVVLILGNGDQVELECKFCAQGWEGPKGMVEVGHRHVEEVSLRTITGVNLRKEHGETAVTYWFGSVGYSGDQVAATRGEALLKATELAKKRDHDERENLTRRKYAESKSYSWNAGFYLQQAEVARKQYERYLQLAKVMQSKAKEKPEVK